MRANAGRRAHRQSAAVELLERRESG